MKGGSLCSGSGGLDLGLERSLGVEWAWHCEPDPHASRVLERWWPGVPNLGDLFAVDWGSVESVDLLAAGIPCPDYSLAGKRAGIEGEHGQVWNGTLRAIRDLRPSIVVLENVTGIRTARGLRPDAGESALGVVLADLASLGYRWAYDCMRAADVGAPHGRDRWFCVAALPSAADALGAGVDADGRVPGRGPRGIGPGRPAPSLVASRPAVDDAEDALADDSGASADADVVGLDRVGGRDATAAPGDGTDGGGSLRDLPDLLGAAAADAERVARPEAGELDGRPGEGEEQGARREEGEAELGAAGRAGGRGDRLLPTPTAGDAGSAGSRNLEGSKAHPGVSLTDAIQTGDSTTPRLLPTPTTGESKTGHGRRGGKPGNGAQSGAELDAIVEASGEIRLLPTPQAADGDGGRQEKGAMAAGGKRPSGQKATLPLPTAVSMREDISETPFAAVAELEQAALFDLDDVDGDGALLPTPVANAENPGAGGELRAALVHGEGRRNETGVDTLGRPNRGRAGSEPDLLPTPNTRDHHAQGSGHNPKAHSTALSTVVEKTDRLLPTTQDAENTAGPSQYERNSDPLNVAAAKLLPTPTAADGEHASEQGPRFYAGGGDNPTLLGAARRSEIAWGVYEGAVRRWETVLGREAPPPTDEKGRLAPEFVTWMLGYPEGWFDIDDLKRTAKLRALGNSVQVQVAEHVGYWARFLVESGLLAESAATAAD